MRNVERWGQRFPVCVGDPGCAPRGKPWVVGFALGPDRTSWEHLRLTEEEPEAPRGGALTGAWICRSAEHRPTAVTTQAREGGGTWHLPPEPSTLTTEEMMYHQGWGCASEIAQRGPGAGVGGTYETHRGQLWAEPSGPLILGSDRGHPVTRRRGAGGHRPASHILLLLTPSFLHAAQRWPPGGLWGTGTGLDKERRGAEEKWAPRGNPLRRPDPVPARAWRCCRCHPCWGNGPEGQGWVVALSSAAAPGPR